jgi:anti-anti-sigma factor
MVDRERVSNGHLHVVDDPEATGCAVADHGPLVVVTLTGEIDLAVVGRLDHAIGSVDLGPVSTLEVDMTGVTFADSSTLAWLLRLCERAEAATTTLVVVISAGPVQRLLEITGMDRRLTTVIDAPGRTLRNAPGGLDGTSGAP